MPSKLKILGVAFLTVTAYIAGTWSNRPPGYAAGEGTSSVRKVLYWACPMHPDYKSDRAGEAPCCGMRLEPVYADGPGAPHGSDAGLIRVSAQQQQLIGVRTEEVRETAGVHVVRLAGRVAPDESRLHRIVAVTDGWIRSLKESAAGTLVRKGQVLASYYTPTLLNAQQNYLFALTTGEVPRRAAVALGAQRIPGSLTVQSALDGLRDLGMHELQIEEIRASQQYAQEINVYAPIDGVVTVRSVSPDQRFEKGSELYRITDIHHLWVLADVFERDVEFVRRGAAARIRYGSHEIPARMSDALPQFDAQTRTLKARFEVDNRDYLLRPDMFVAVEIETRPAAGISVPAEAVMENGRGAIVFVEKAQGLYEPRRVVPGWRAGDRVQVQSGLAAGERIVVSGNFLIDSERRMRAGAGSAGVPDRTVAKTGRAKDPICGMEADPAARTAITLDVSGTRYYFCSEQCRRAFASGPAKHTHNKRPA